MTTPTVHPEPIEPSAPTLNLTIHSLAGNYSVVIGAGSFDEIVDLPGQIGLVDSRFGDMVAKFPSPAVLVDAVEEQKTVSYADTLLARLRAAGANRSTTLLAIGGGMVQDMATFIASIYMRGLKWRYVPTTLMAMADSCIGGKSSLNVDGYKNLAGNIYPPQAVTIDPMFLATQSREQLVCGLAEAAKISFCRSSETFNTYLAFYGSIIDDPTSATPLLHLVLAAKKWFVETDEFDQRERRLLNFGHTFGHAIEAATSFAVPHGVAVCLGMLCAVDVAGIASSPIARLRVHCLSLLEQVPHLGVRLLSVDMDRFARCFRTDKKHTDGELRLILPRIEGGVAEVSMRATPASMAAISSSVERVFAAVSA